MRHRVWAGMVAMVVVGVPPAVVTADCHKPTGAPCAAVVAAYQAAWGKPDAMAALFAPGADLVTAQGVRAGAGARTTILEQIRKDQGTGLKGTTYQIALDALEGGHLMVDGAREQNLALVDWDATIGGLPGPGGTPRDQAEHVTALLAKVKVKGRGESLWKWRFLALRSMYPAGKPEPKK